MSDEKPRSWAIDSEGRIRGADGDIVCPLPVGWERDPRRVADAGVLLDAPRLHDENKAILDLLRRLESEVACTCSDTADAAECACDEGSAVDCGCVCHPLSSLLDKHGRSP